MPATRPESTNYAAMCELFGVSASRPVRPTLLLREFRLRGGFAADNRDGWGVSYWQPAEFRLFKEPEPGASSALFGELVETVTSTLIVAHVRKARHPPIAAMANTHPFLRRCCGREWVFAHNGLVPGIVDLDQARDNAVCRPTGATDSEHAFCHVLAELARAFEGERGRDVTAWMPALAAESEELAAFGKFNFLMSDGEHLIAYGHDRLHYTEQANDTQSIETAASRVLISTEPLSSAAGWVAFEPGELRVYRSGVLAWRAATRPKPVASADGRGPVPMASEANAEGVRNETSRLP